MSKHQPLRDQLREGRMFFSPAAPFSFRSGPFEGVIRTYACPHCGRQIFDVVKFDGKDGGVWLDGSPAEDGAVVLIYSCAGTAQAAHFSEEHAGMHRWNQHACGREWSSVT